MLINTFRITLYHGVLTWLGPGYRTNTTCRGVLGGYWGKQNIKQFLILNLFFFSEINSQRTLVRKIFSNANYGRKLVFLTINKHTPSVNIMANCLFFFERKSTITYYKKKKRNTPSKLNRYCDSELLLPSFRR